MVKANIRMAPESDDTRVVDHGDQQEVHENSTRVVTAASKDSGEGPQHIPRAVLRSAPRRHSCLRVAQCRRENASRPNTIARRILAGRERIQIRPEARVVV